MAERYDMAARRHLHTGEILETAGEFDDAGYHFGVCGENAVKFALWAANVHASWAASGGVRKLRKTPMLAHFPTLQSRVTDVQNEIRLYAQGRHAAPILAFVLSPNFALRFSGWHIDIRYADSNYTPVLQATCAAWRVDAEDLVLGLVI